MFWPTHLLPFPDPLLLNNFCQSVTPSSTWFCWKTFIVTNINIQKFYMFMADYGFIWEKILVFCYFFLYLYIFLVVVLIYLIFSSHFMHSIFFIIWPLACYTIVTAQVTLLIITETELNSLPNKNIFWIELCIYYHYKFKTKTANIFLVWKHLILNAWIKAI